MEILNLTQHAATPEQLAAGVVEPVDKALVQALLTFEELPTSGEFIAKAKALAEMTRNDGFGRAMIGGAPFFMSTLERVLLAYHIVPLYAFSRRESVDEHTAEGVKKTQVFKHRGFVTVEFCPEGLLVVSIAS